MVLAIRLNLYIKGDGKEEKTNEGFYCIYFEISITLKKIKKDYCQIPIHLKNKSSLSYRKKMSHKLKKPYEMVL